MVIRKLYISPVKEVIQLFSIKHWPFNLRKSVNFKVPTTEMYTQIPWQLVEDLLGSAEQTLRTTDYSSRICTRFIFILHISYARDPKSKNTKRVQRIILKFKMSHSSCRHDGQQIFSLKLNTLWRTRYAAFSKWNK